MISIISRMQINSKFKEMTGIFIQPVAEVGVYPLLVASSSTFLVLLGEHNLLWPYG